MKNAIAVLRALLKEAVSSAQDAEVVEIYRLARDFVTAQSEDEFVEAEEALSEIVGAADFLMGRASLKQFNKIWDSGWALRDAGDTSIDSADAFATRLANHWHAHVVSKR